MKKRPWTRAQKVKSPSVYDPTVTYDELGGANNHQLAVFRGAAAAEPWQPHSGVSPAVIGTLADFEDDDGLSIAEQHKQHKPKETS